MLTTQSSTSQSGFARRIKLLGVYGTVLRILMSYGLLKLAGYIRGPEWVNQRRHALHRKNARRVERMILGLKGLFIKVGQLISILTNFLPEDFRIGLEGLQDRIPARPTAEIQQRIETELGAPLATLFKAFDPEAVASASLAQVHRATLHDGRHVAVKVQHLDIEKTARMDLKTIRNLFGLVGTFLRVKGLTTQYEQLSDMILDELDFTKEALHIQRIAENLKDHPGVAFPVVVNDHSSQRVLTTEFIDAIKISNTEALTAQGIDREALAQRVVEAYCQMVFEDGFYHADPHPGNIFVRPDGTIVFIDFGAVATLSPAMKSGIPQMLMGVIQQNPERIKKAISQMGFVAYNQDDETVDNLIASMYDRFIEDLDLSEIQLNNINAKSTMDAKLDMWSDMRRLNISIRDLMSTFQVPKDWILLDRTILLILGLCTHLHPEMNPMQILQPYLERTVLGPDGDWKTFLSDAVKDVAKSAISIPNEMQRLLARANRGELEVQITGLQKSTNLLYALGHQFLFGLLALGSAVMAYTARVDGDETVTLVAGIAGGLFLLLTFNSILKARRWRKR
ncbi:MAG: AarF/UbiB family protein [Bacteroidota bacterium]